ncbi:MAG: TadE/TadG family type IV pilus assembly protein [bacterium]|nr:TadE/TadG family type IV pilus assembly protein [bacterium]
MHNLFTAKHVPLAARQNLTARQKKQHGAVMVEFAISGLLLITTILALIDLGRIFYIQNTLNKAADNALSLAQKIENLQTETRTLNPSVAAQQAQLNDFTAALDAVEAEANQLLSASLVSPPGTDSAARLLPITIYDKNASGNMILTRDIGILRPGASVKYTDSYGRTQWFAHPTHCNNAAPNCTVPLAASANWDSTIKNEPLVVEIKAQVSTIVGGIIPFLDNATLTGRAIGYREVLPKGAYAESYALPSASTTVVTTSVTTTTSTSTSVTTSVATSATSVPSSSVTTAPPSTSTTTSSAASTGPSTSTTTTVVATSVTSVSSSSTVTTSTTTTSISCASIRRSCYFAGGSYHYNGGACYCAYSG